MRLALLPLLAVLLVGCLPSSERRTTTELFPADSLSRQVAEAAPEDTLVLVWQVAFPDGARQPMTLAWDADRLVSVDTETGAFYVFDAETGALRHDDRETGFQFPFLGGIHADTAAVVNRGDGTLRLIALSGTPREVASWPLPEGRNAVAARTARGTYVRTTGRTEGGTLTRLDGRGEVAESVTLDGPFWRYVGFMRAWGDSVIAMTGYRPVVDVIGPDRLAPDSTLLVGFDSPQLARSRQFVLGDLREPPLLTPSASAAGDRLVVLNARPGWVHLDLFRREAGGLRLERTLLSPNPGLQRQFFAPDVAARADGEALDVVVLEHHPHPHLTRYRWAPTSSVAGSATGSAADSR